MRGVVPQPKADFGIDDFGIGIRISAFVLVNGIVTVPAGYLADHWHRTRTIGHTVVAWSGITMLTAAVPAHLRGAGFGAFNLVSIVFGAPAALMIVGALADVFNLRIAFLIVSPLVFLGAYVFYRARDHLDADAAKIFEAVVQAMQQDQERADT